MSNAVVIILLKYLFVVNKLLNVDLLVFKKMSNNNFSKQRRVFGGINFVVVLWALLSVFRLSMSMQDMTWDSTFKTIVSFMVPLFFLALLNIFIGITLFLPQKKNNMWLISLVIVTGTLVVLNTFQTKINNLENTDTSVYTVVDY
ncbi:hypothetical protein ACFLZK_00995 [Patescibacteria group bacterium]